MDALPGRPRDPRSVYVELQSLVAISHDLDNFKTSSEFMANTSCNIHYNDISLSFVSTTKS